MAGLIASPDNRLTALAAKDFDQKEALRDLFWRSLTRAPSEAEMNHLLPLLQDTADRRAALEDIVWSLINSKEFILRH
ncbi:MAG: hypothetical protein EOP84_37000 [Verrucomicrobiaceae bacterium]|nr:MAG: hypothetical protein EOP84_37000 [Verrucomicrobiaceae bacterium]